MKLRLFLLGLALLLPSITQAKPKKVPFPTREELRSLQLLAYSCSRANDQESCSKTRSLADPLMDHPRLSAACKDTVWELVQASQVGTTNSFQRRDSIDRPAVLRSGASERGIARTAAPFRQGTMEFEAGTRALRNGPWCSLTT